MAIDRLVDDVDPKQRGPLVVGLGTSKVTGEPIVVHLTVAEQRKIAEAEAKGPVVRIWLKPSEYEACKGRDWTMYALSDGRYACWRRRSDIDVLMEHGEIATGLAILERQIDDTVV